MAGTHQPHTRKLFPCGYSWIRIRLPMQGTWVQSLVREDSTCHGETKFLCHNYWSPSALGPASCNYWSLCSAMREATARRSLLATTDSRPCVLHLEEAWVRQRRPSAVKTNRCIRKPFSANGRGYPSLCAEQASPGMQSQFGTSASKCVLLWIRQQMSTALLKGSR